MIGNEKRVQEGILAKIQSNSLVMNGPQFEYFTEDRTSTVPVNDDILWDNSTIMYEIFLDLSKDGTY